MNKETTKELEATLDSSGEGLPNDWDRIRGDCLLYTSDAADE